MNLKKHILYLIYILISTTSCFGEVNKFEFEKKYVDSLQEGFVWGTFINQVDSGDPLYLLLIYSVKGGFAFKEMVTPTITGDSIELIALTKKKLRILYLRNDSILKEDTIKAKIKQRSIVIRKTKLWGVPLFFWGLSSEVYKFNKLDKGLSMEYLSWSNAYWLLLIFERDRYKVKKESIYFGG